MAGSLLPEAASAACSVGVEVPDPANSPTESGIDNPSIEPS